MKKINNNILIKIYILSFFCMQTIHADTMTAINLTSQKVTINFETEQKKYTLEANPSENLYLQENLDNQSNQYDNPLPKINYDHSQVKKIVINRMQSNMPQIIYYNGERSSDSHNNVTGIYGTYISHAASIQVYQDSVTINNLSYNINDTSSFTAKCKKLKELLANGLQEKVQKEVDDISESIRLIEQSSMAVNYTLQTTVIQSELDELTNQMKVMQQIKQYNVQIDYLIQNTRSDNVDTAKSLLKNMLISLQILDQSDTQNQKSIQSVKTKSAILEKQIASIEHQNQLTKIPMMVEQKN